MILQALCRYYEVLLQAGQAPPLGYSWARVSYALSLDSKGGVQRVIPLQCERLRGQKMEFLPQILTVPEQKVRASGVAANFLCDNAGYLLGVDAKGNPQRTAECFAAAKELHENVMMGMAEPAAQAILQFFAHWDAFCAQTHPALQEY